MDVVVIFAKLSGRGDAWIGTVRSGSDRLVMARTGKVCRIGILMVGRCTRRRRPL